MLDKRLSGDKAVALQQAEHARMQAAMGDGRANRLGHYIRGARMCRMPLDDNWTPRSQRRRRVAACGRKGQREVGRAKDGDRADRTLYHPQIRPRQRRAIRKGHVMATVQIGARFDMIGKEVQLARGSSPLTNKSRFRQAGFVAPDLGDLIATRIDFDVNPAQKRRALGGQAMSVDIKCLFGGTGRPIHQAVPQGSRTGRRRVRYLDRSSRAKKATMLHFGPPAFE